MAKCHNACWMGGFLLKKSLDFHIAARQRYFNFWFCLVPNLRYLRRCPLIISFRIRFAISSSYGWILIWMRNYCQISLDRWSVAEFLLPVPLYLILKASILLCHKERHIAGQYPFWKYTEAVVLSKRQTPYILAMLWPQRDRDFKCNKVFTGVKVSWGFYGNTKRIMNSICS